ALTAEFTVGEGKLMTHDEPCSMAPDEKHDLISGTCSHLPFLTDGTAPITVKSVAPCLGRMVAVTAVSGIRSSLLMARPAKLSARTYSVNSFKFLLYHCQKTI
ncbi:hypothetical protein ACV1CZ_20015, partial [Aeromonas caviae]